MMDKLPPLRGDISLVEGPWLEGGRPSWVVVDEALGQHFQLSWRDAEIFKRWSLHNASEIAEQVNEETALTICNKDVLALHKFFLNNSLLRIGVKTIHAARNIQKSQHQARQFDLLMASKRLFPKVALCDPQNVLKVIAPLFGFAFYSGFWLFLGLMVLVGGTLAMNNPLPFFVSPETFLTVENGLVALFCIILSKLIHELGHAVSAQRFGVRVPLLGFTFFAFVPLAYSDVNDAWRLSSRRQRAVIAVSGLGAEAMLATAALMVWSFLPEGAMQFGCFFLAVVVFPLSVILNLNPFMKFDGYYLATESLQVDTLQERGRAYFRYCLLRLLIGERAGATPEMSSSSRLKRILFWYGAGMVVNRLLMIAGIGLMISAVFGGVAGLFVFCAVLIVFLSKPFVLVMMRTYGRMESRKSFLQMGLSGGVMCSLLVLAFVPYRTSYHAPASVTYGTPVAVYAPHEGQVSHVQVEVGEHVEAGQVLLSLVSPDLDLEAEQLSLQAEALKLQQRHGDGGQTSLEQAIVVDEQLIQVAEDLRRLTQTMDALEIKAPVSGRVDGIVDGLVGQRWLGDGQKILQIVTRADQGVYTAYLDERVRDHLDGQMGASFWNDTLSLPQVKLEEVAVDEQPVASIPMPHLTSSYGGILNTTVKGGGQYVPRYAHYKARLFLAVDNADGKSNFVGKQSGYVRYQTKPLSLARRAVEHVGDVFSYTFATHLW